MKLTVEQRQSMAAAALPLQQWLEANGHPHCSVIVDSHSAGMREDIALVMREMKDVKTIAVKGELPRDLQLSARPIVRVEEPPKVVYTEVIDEATQQDIQDINALAAKAEECDDDAQTRMATLAEENGLDCNDYADYKTLAADIIKARVAKRAQDKALEEDPDTLMEVWCCVGCASRKFLVLPKPGARTNCPSCGEDMHSQKTEVYFTGDHQKAPPTEDKKDA